MKIGSREFEIGRHTYIMGILNVTPDSFSDGGKYLSMDAALRHTEKMLLEGMDILDIGGESTRPGHTQISAEEEIKRVVPVIEAVKKRFDIPVSVDTYKSTAAKAAVEAGADLVNDIWGLKYDSAMARVIADSGVCCCLMHNREKAEYTHFMDEVLEDLRDSLSIAENAGITREKIILDPGVGFGKTYEDNLEVLRSLSRFAELSCPMLLGTSRKSVIGLTLDLPTSERVEGTLVTTVLAVLNRWPFVRVHDIKENRRAIQMMEAVNG